MVYYFAVGRKIVMIVANTIGEAYEKIKIYCGDVSKKFHLMDVM